MKLISFEYFLTVAENGSVRQAAEKLNVSASSITRQIQQLEHDFGCELFERRNDGMALTEEGLVLQRHMQNTVRELDLARDEISHIHEMLAGTVRFSSIEGTMGSWLLPTIASFRERYENIRFEGTVDSSDAVYQAVVSDQVDFGIAMLNKPSHDVDVLMTFDTTFKIVVSPTHSLARKRKLCLRDIEDRPLVMLSPAFYTRQLFDQLAASQQHNYDIALELNHIELLKREVMTHGSITVLPDYAVQEELENGTLCGFSIQDELPEALSTVLFKKKDRQTTRSASMFMEMLAKAQT